MVGAQKVRKTDLNGGGTPHRGKRLLRGRTWGMLAAAVVLGTGIAIPAASFADNSSGCDFAPTGTTQLCSQPLQGSTFAGGDGNLLTSPTTFGTTDWQNVAGLNPGFDLVSGQNDNSFGQGTKEDSPNVSVVTGSIPNNKSDLTRFYEAAEVGSNGHNFLYLAWERNNVLGTANMDFEINQNKNQPDLTTTGAKTLNRTAGDLLVTYDFTNGGGKPTLGLLFWLTAAAGNTASQCFSSNTLPCWGKHVTLNGTDSIGAVNNLDPVTDPLFPLKPNYLNSVPALQFGETAIDLTAAGVFPAGTCEAFGSAFLKSRASASFTAEVKDFIAPIPVNISNCGEIKIIKQTDPRGINKDFSFTSTIPGPGTSNPATPSCTQSPSDPTSFTLNDAGNASKTLGSTAAADNSSGNTQDCTNVVQGSYTVSEGNAPGGFTFESLACTPDATSGSTVTKSGQTATITLKPEGVVTCLYINKQNTATLATQVSSAGPVFPGTAVHDTATVTGSQATLTPSGTVTFFLCGPIATGSCSTGGTNIGTGQLNGSGTTATAPSPDVNTSGAGALSPGRYCFRAEWPGDTNYPGALSEFGGATGTNECFTVQVLSTTTKTTPSVGSGGSTTFGSKVTDSAIITAAQSGDGTPTGTVTFFVCNPTQTSGDACPDPNGTKVGSAVTTTAVSGSDPPQSTAMSSEITADMAGTWCFRAVYTPDTPNYTGSSDATSDECFTVTDTTASASTQDWLPNDTATVSSINGAPLKGTLSVQLYTGDNCGATSGSKVDGQLYTKSLDGSSNTASLTTTNGADPANTFKVTAPGATTVSWLVTFTSTDSNVSGSNHCETTSLTINNNP
jgi:hypothetical protein